MTSMMTMLPASTLSFPVSTMIVFSSILDVLTFTTLSCAVVTSHIHLASTSIFLSIILCCKSIAWLACSSIIEMSWLQEVLVTLSINYMDITPEGMRMVVVVVACVSLGRDIITLIMTVKLLKSTKKNDDIIPWSYREQGLYYEG